MKIEKQISQERLIEMDRYGRTKTYKEISNFLKGNIKKTFELINHVPAIIDDEIDNKKNKNILNRAKEILSKGFRNEKIIIQNENEKQIFALGKTLHKLEKEQFKNTKIIFEEILNYWKIEDGNLDRKGKILDSHELDKLNLNIGKSVGLQFLYLLCPNLNIEQINLLASSYGFAIKLADNLSDIKEDIEQEFINISNEDIKKYDLKIKNLEEKNLNEYVQNEFKRVKEKFLESDNLAKKISDKNPLEKRGISLFKEISHSWLKQVEEMCFVNELRKFDIQNYSEPRFLTEGEIKKMEVFYETNLAKIIQLSYEQESRNTLKNREKDFVYNPYFPEGILKANERIKKIISKYPKIKEVLDLGCDNGERTIELYSGKKLYGIEFVNDSIKQSKKKGIKVYLGSIISEVYPNKKFDLVSLLGEMVNFVGLETNSLLKNSVKQIKDKGYFLVTCTHSNFDNSQNGEYAIWSFKKSTEKKWLLKENKIPRAFLVISKQNLFNRIKEISKNQECELTLKEEFEVQKYHENLNLGIYLFQKTLKC